MSERYFSIREIPKPYEADLEFYVTESELKWRLGKAFLGLTDDMANRVINILVYGEAGVEQLIILSRAELVHSHADELLDTIEREEL